VAPENGAWVCKGRGGVGTQAWNAGVRVRLNVRAQKMTATKQKESRKVVWHTAGKLITLCLPGRAHLLSS